MGSKKFEWVEQTSLGGLFVVHWTSPHGGTCWNFFQTLGNAHRMDKFKQLFVVKKSSLIKHL
jgi:hypothetical protein